MQSALLAINPSTNGAKKIRFSTALRRTNSFGICRRELTLLKLFAETYLYSYELRNAVNASALETWGDEFEEAGIKKAPSRLVRPPRVADSPVSFECRVHSIVRVANEAHGSEMAGPHLVGNSDIVIGRVVGIHIKGEYITGDGVSIPPCVYNYWLTRCSFSMFSRRLQLLGMVTVNIPTSIKSGTWTFQ
jgi:hypothetical protein